MQKVFLSVMKWEHDSGMQLERLWGSSWAQLLDSPLEMRWER